MKPRFQRKYLVLRYIQDLELVAEFYPSTMTHAAKYFGDSKPSRPFIAEAITTATWLRRDHGSGVHGMSLERDVDKFRTMLAKQGRPEATTMSDEDLQFVIDGAKQWVGRMRYSWKIVALNYILHGEYRS